MLTFYKPNRSNKGALANFKLISKQSKDGEPFKDGCVYLSIVKQVGWNEEARTGSFKNGETINIKLNAIELGGMLSVIERGTKFDTVHNSREMVSISFSPWLDKNTQVLQGYTLYVSRSREGQKETFNFGFRVGEDLTLREFLKLAIQHILLATYAEEKRRFKAAIHRNPVSVEDDDIVTPEPPMVGEDDDDIPLFG